VSRASGASKASGTRPGTQRKNREAQFRDALRASIFSWVPALAPATPSLRPGHEREHAGAAHPSILIHLSNSPSQRFACPLNPARGRRVSLFPFSPTGSGAPRRRKPGSRLRSATIHAVEAWGVPCDRDARLSALHRGDFGPGAALPSPALPPENAFSELLAAQVIVPGGRGPEPSEPAVTSRRGTPLPAPLQGPSRETPVTRAGIIPNIG